MLDAMPPLSDTAQRLQPGVYQHYKGGQYRITGVARHSETLEEVIMYQALYGDHGWWIRPLPMFVGNVTVDGRDQPRFRFLHD